MSRFYAQKILFNITQADLDGMDAARAGENLTQSDFIRKAIRAYVAEQKLVTYISARDPNMRS